MVPRRRAAGRSHRATRRNPQAALPSVLEIAVYGILAAVVAAGLLVVGGQPVSLAIAVLGGSVGLIGVLALASARVSRNPPEPESAAEPSHPGEAPGRSSSQSTEAPHAAAPAAPRTTSHTVDGTEGRKTSKHAAGRRRRRH